MQLVNCRRCGQLFVRQGVSEVCGSCSDREEHRLRQVKDYLYRCPGAPLNIVVQETGVELALIRRWIDDGRLGQR